MWAICGSCGRAFERAATQVEEATQIFCRACRERLRAGQQLLRTTFEERVRLKTVRFKVAMGQTTDFPGEVSLPDRRVPGAAWYEARAILEAAWREFGCPAGPGGESGQEAVG